MEKKMLTVKEWTKKSGLKIYNYDGFLDIYEKLSRTNLDTFLEHSEARFRDAGDLVCSREAFETHINGCTMKMPKIEELDSIADVIPHFVENFLNLRLSTTIGMAGHGMILQSETSKVLASVLDAIAKKLSARAKSIAMYKLEDVNLSRITDDELKKQVDRILDRKAQTVEEAEIMLSQSIAREIEETLKEENITIPKTLINKLHALTGLFYHSARSRKVYSLSTDFMLVSSPLEKKEDLVIPYNMIDGGGMHPGVLFDVENGNVRTQGAMPITEDAKERLDEEMGNKVL